MMNKITLAPIVLTILTVAGCSSLSSQNSPDVIYSSEASESRSLQVPPDLTDVSNAQQFVLPGNRGGTVARNTLLPQFDNMRFVREGQQSWLEFQQTPEDLWPQLLAFVRSEKYRIDQTEPVAGVIMTQWRPDSAVGEEGLLRNLVGDDEALTRVAFRMERAGNGARLFARSQTSSRSAVDASGNAVDTDWPASSHNPEATSEMLNRLLVFLGVEQQKARGVLGDEQASAILDNAVVQSNAAGSEMILNRGFQVSFRQVERALTQLQYAVLSSDDNAGRIEFNSQQTPLVLEISPLHISAVRITLLDAQGAKLQPERELQLLSALAEQLA